MTKVSTKKAVPAKKAPAKAAVVKKAAVPKAAAPKAAAPKAAAPAKAAVVKEAAPLKQLLPGDVLTAEIVTRKGNKIVSTETIRLPQKSAMTLAVLQQAAGNPMPKAELFAGIRKMFKIETSQDGFRVNAQCHLLEAAGLAVMTRVDGGGMAQYRSATERGMQVVLPAITRIK